MANYGEGSEPSSAGEPDYTEYQKIGATVEQVIGCTDFDAPVVQLYCLDSSGQKSNNITGKINSYKLLAANQVEFLVSNNESGFYKVIVPHSIIDDFEEDLNKLLNKNIKIYDVAPEQKNASQELIITNKKQLVIK